jgi:hypothetical protein
VDYVGGEYVNGSMRAYGMCVMGRCIEVVSLLFVGRVKSEVR